MAIRMTRFLVILVAAVLILVRSGRASDEIVVDSAVLSLIEHAEVPAAEAGRLTALHIYEGDAVIKGQAVAQIEDEDVRLLHKRAELELASARFLAEDASKIDLARKGSEKQRQLLIEQEIDLDVSTREADNDIPIRATAKALEVAENELQRGVRSREAFKNSISDSQLDGLLLAVERAKLLHEQAQFELDILKRKLQGKAATLKTQNLAVEFADLEIRQVESLQELARLQVNLKQHDVETAVAGVQRRIVASPLDGVVVEIYRRRGEWVEPGEKVLRIVRLNRLRAEGFLPVESAGSSLPGRPALIEVSTPDNGIVTKTGTITFVSPEVDPINQEVRIWAEFDNEAPRVSPGMRARIRIVGAAPKTTRPQTAGASP